MISAYFIFSNLDLFRDIPPAHQFVPIGDPAVQEGYPALVPPTIHLNPRQMSVYPILTDRFEVSRPNNHTISGKGWRETDLPKSVAFSCHGSRVGSNPVIYLENSYRFIAAYKGLPLMGSTEADWSLPYQYPHRVLPTQIAPAALNFFATYTPDLEPQAMRPQILSYYFESKNSRGKLTISLAQKYRWPYSQSLLTEMEGAFRYGVAAFLGYDHIRPQFEKLGVHPVRAKSFVESGQKGYHLSHLLNHAKLKTKIDFVKGLLSFRIQDDSFVIAIGSNWFWLNGQLQESDMITVINNGSFYVGRNLAAQIESRIPILDEEDSKQ